MIYLFPERDNTQTIFRASNRSSNFNISVNTNKIKAILKAVFVLTLVIGYIAITVLSYAISPVYFWTLIKAGVVLIFSAIIRFIK